MLLEQFERDAEAFSAALARERYLHYAGLRPELDTATVYERYPDVASAEAFGRLRDQPLGPRMLGLLLGFVATNVLERGTRALGEQLAVEEAAATIEWRAGQVAYRSAPIVQANEPDLGRRHGLDELVRAETARGNPERWRRLLELGPLCGELGYRDVLDLRAEVSGRAEADDAALSETFLRSTRDAYEQALRDQLVHHKLDGADVWEVDLAWVLRGRDYDGLLPGHELLPALYRTLPELGVRLEDQPNVSLDLAARPSKSAASFCAPIAVPDSVVAVVAPRGGLPDFVDLLEQAGHAEQFACVDRTQPFAWRRLGDPAVGVAYALLLSGLAGQAAWLRWRLDLDQPREIVRLASFRALYELRRAAGQAQYERELYRAEEPELLAERYAELFSAAVGVRVFPDGYLLEPAGLLGPRDRLRGAALALQLRAFLEREYDEEWFRSARAGAFLRDRWREGRRYTADELARFLGFDDVDVASLTRELCSAVAAQG